MTASNNDTIRPYRVEVPESELRDLRERLERTRWPAELPGTGWSRGVPLAYLKGLAEYWRSGFDWRAQEAKLNAFPQFTTTIDGENIHFLHVRSPEEKAMPLLLTHGWPGSVVEFMKIIGPLTNPRAHGADPKHAFHVVAPSIPGFGFSGPTHEAGWDTGRVARAWVELMKRLGYRRYAAQGGDTGGIVSPELGRIDGEHVIGIHVNNLGTFPSGDPTELADLPKADQARLEHMQRMSRDGIAYAMIQSTRPQTIGYALTDSPVGQLAWIVEKFKEWTNPNAELPEDAVDRDQMLANVTIYWLTRTGASSAHIYYEGGRSWGQAPQKSKTPTGVAVFPGDITIRRLAERDHTVVHWSEFDRGGHFPAMEVPDLLVADMRTFFDRLR